MTKCKAELAGLTKVRITRELGGWPVGSIVWHDGYDMAYNDGMSSYYFHEIGSSCEIVKDEVMYKVGDKVRMSNVGKLKYPDCINNPHNLIGKYLDDESFLGHSVVWPNGKINSYRTEEIEPYTATTFQVGETYTTAAGHANKCIHIENNIAWCVSARDDGTVYGVAYTWDMDGNYLNAPLSDRHLYKITIGPIVERKTVIASVDYVDGEPDWGTAAVDNVILSSDQIEKMVDKIISDIYK